MTHTDPEMVRRLARVACEKCYFIGDGGEDKVCPSCGNKDAKTVAKALLEAWETKEQAIRAALQTADVKIYEAMTAKDGCSDQWEHGMQYARMIVRKMAEEYK